MNDAITANQEQMEEWESSALEESNKAIEEVTQSSDALDQAQAQNEEEVASAKDDSGYSAEDEQPEMDPIEM
jgi:uncharacterized membrane protein YukC